MKDIFTIWKYPKMVSLVALCAALYAALLIPFKTLMIIPGFEVRIATAIVPAMGILFGPAGAWGAAIGNLVGDFFGSIGVGSIFGFFANFFFAYLPYKIWYSGSENSPSNFKATNKIVKYLTCSLCATMAQICVLCYGLAGILSLVSYIVMVPILAVTNGVVPFVLGIPLLALFAPRLKKWNLLFTSVCKPSDFKIGSKTNKLGVILAIVGGVISIGLSLYVGIAYEITIGSTLFLINLPFVLMFFIGMSLIGMQKGDFEVEE